jgi:acetyl esterase/lipase
MTDYSELIDAETWAFIEKTAESYPDDTVSLSIAGQRDVYNAMCRVFHAGYPDGVSAIDDSLAAEGRSIPVRRYTLSAPDAGKAMVVYYHGGGYVVGGLESHDDVCAEICARTGYSVVSVDYRLCPEFVHPAPSDDAIDAFSILASEFDGPIVVSGDSAGGNLAAIVSHVTRGAARHPIGQVLIYPGLGGDNTKGSYVRHANAPMLTAADHDFYTEVRAGGADVSGDATFSALADTDFSGLPPTVVITGQCDLLSDDGRDYRDALLAAGGKAVWVEEPGLVHGYLRARHSVARAKASFTRIIEAISALGRSEWPY